MAWKDWRDGPVTIRYAHDRGGAWETTSVYTNNGATLPFLVITPDDVIHLFFNTGGNPNRSVVITKPVAGGSWSSQTPIDEAEGSLMGSAAVDSNGGIYATYFNVRFDPNHGENYGRYKPLGAVWQPRQTIKNAPATGWPVGNKVTAHGNTFIIGYSNSELKPWYRVRDANGALGPERKVAEIGTEPKIVVNPTNTNEWAARFGHDWRTWVVLSHDGGQNWGTPFNPSQLVSGPPAVELEADLAYTSDGALHYVWKRIGNGVNDKGAYYRRRGPDGQWDGMANWAPWSIAAAGPGSRNSLVASGDLLHAALSASVIADDFNNAIHMKYAVVTPPDTTPPGPVNEFKATPCNGKVVLDWTNPADLQFAGTRILVKVEGFPAGPSDGILIADVNGQQLQEKSIEYATDNGTTYYFSAFAFDSANNFGPARSDTAHPAMRSDFDADGDVDQSDFGHFQACLTGSTIPQWELTCLDARLDGDEDVDQNDFGILQACFSEANQLADPGCDAEPNCHD